MPKAADAKTGLVRKLRRPIVVDVIIVLIIAILVGGFLVIENSGDKLKVNGHVYSLTVAKTLKEQGQALGRHTDLPNNQGILFSYTNEARRCFLMKGAHVPFDMVWADANKNVVAIAHSVTSSNYPKICSDQVAKYVIALSAGQVDLANIQAGQSLSF